VKVTITDDTLLIEDGPDHDPTLSEEDAAAVALLQALTWAMGRVLESAQRVTLAQAAHAVAAEQANQAIGRLRQGLH
jgi:hypothetical protein